VIARLESSRLAVLIRRTRRWKFLCDLRTACMRSGQLTSQSDARSRGLCAGGVRTCERRGDGNCCLVMRREEPETEPQEMAV
jgi:hypothetical protein